MSYKTGRSHLYPDTSKFATGSALYQIQNRKPKMIVYASKRLPEATRSYSITELELCGLAISHLLRREDFDAIVDHLTLMHIIKSKMELATTRLKRLLELISSYSFNPYYMKGKDMILSDFYHDRKIDSNLHEIIPFSFNMYQILENKSYLGNNFCNDKYLIQTRSQAKSSGIKLQEVYGMRKNLDPNLKPEKQHTLSKQGNLYRLCIGQGRAGSKRKRPDPINHEITKHPSCHRKYLAEQNRTRKTNYLHSTDLMHSINNATDKMANNNPLIPDVAFHPGPVYSAPPKPIKQNMTHVQSSQCPNVKNINPNINFDFEENLPFQEGIMSKNPLCPKYLK